MCDSVVILRMYSCVLHEHKNKYGVNDADIRTAIQNMKEVYKPNPSSLSDSTVYVADYNDAGHRCAYLHKYAPFHTALVADMLEIALQQNPKVFKDLIYPTGKINICSLGGGPGTDIFGVLSVLNSTFGLFQVSATVIDCMEKWKDMFYDLISELRYGNYGALGECVGEQYFEWTYLQHNLLSKMTNQVNQAIARANLVTMIKFVSASSCKDTSAMLRKIFASVKPGAVILYIENAGGGFHEMVTKEAKNCNLESLFSRNHENCVKSDFNVKKFGYVPCFESRVSVFIWRKRNSKNISCSPPSYSYKEQGFLPLSTIAILPAEKRENRLQNETVTSNNRVSVHRTSADIDNKNFFQKTLHAKNRTNIPFVSSDMNAKTVGNSLGKLSEPEKREQSRKIPAEGFDRYRISTDTINSNNINFVGKQLHSKHGSSSASEAEKVEVSEYSLGKLIEPQRKEYSNETLAEKCFQVGFAWNNINTDFVRNQLHAEHKTSRATISNVKNINPFHYVCDNSPETRTTINRREVTAEASIPSRNTSKAFNWLNCIRDAFFQELLGLITGEFINFFQEDQISTVTYFISQSVGERLQLFLFESFE